MEVAIKNKTSERIIIGILLNNPEWIIDNIGLKAEYFFDKTHRWIYFLINKLIQENSPTIDSMTILARAEKFKEATETLEASGGYEYLENMKYLGEEYSRTELKIHAKTVIECAYKREQILQKEEFLHLIKNEEQWEVPQINEWLQTKQFELQTKFSLGTEVGLISDIFDEAWLNIESNRDESGIVGLPSKIPLVNEYFTYRKGELVILGARSKFGKSNFGINEVHNLAVKNKVPVAYFDTEMKTETFIARILSIDSGIPVQEIENGMYLTDETKTKKLEQSKQRIKQAPIIHKYSYNWDKSKVRDLALLLKTKHKIELLVYDYIKVKEVGNNDVKEHNELGNWTIFLKDLAGELDMPVLSFGQLSPHETRLADSDKINRYASTIAYLLPKTREQIARDGGLAGGLDYMYIDYNRNGASMHEEGKGINLLYDRPTVTFGQAPNQILLDEYQ